MPTKAQWDAVRDTTNNPQQVIGTWSASPTNYSNGVKFGPDLMLPAAGGRSNYGGQLFSRGYNGYYWSSTEDGTDDAWYLVFSSGGANTSYDYRRDGFSLRCLAE